MEEKALLTLKSDLQMVRKGTSVAVILMDDTKKDGTLGIIGEGALFLGTGETTTLIPYWQIKYIAPSG